MAELDYEEFNEELGQLFADKKYAEGMAFADKHLADFPDQQANIHYLRVCMAARMENLDLANEILNSALSNGIWYSEMILRKSPSLSVLQEHPEFERLVDVSLKMQAADPVDHMPVLVIRPEDACEKGGEGCPMMLFLHGNSDTVKANLAQWAPLPNLGWLLAMPQSSRAMWAESYAWLDYETGGEEVTQEYMRIREQYAIDEDKTILSGFSMGGEIALALALDGRIPAKGFILIGPGGPYMDDLSNWSPLINKASDKNMRGVILMGEADTSIPQNNIRILVDRFNQSGIKCKLKSYPGLKHAYPDDFQQALGDAIEYILG